MSTQALPSIQSATVTSPASTKPTFVHTVMSEAMRLTRFNFIGAGIVFVVGLTLLVTIITLVSASDTATAEGDPFDLSVAALEASDGIVAAVEGSANLVGIVVLSLAAIAVAGDYGTGLIRLLVQAEPRRWRLIAGKLTALAGFTVGAAALATVTGVAASFATAPMAGISTGAWTDGVAGTVSTTFLNLSLGLLVWMMIGFVIAVVTRSTAAAVAGGIGYVLVFENVLGLVSSTLADWLPGSAIAALVAGGNDSLSYGTALALSAGYALLGLAISLAVFQRRDITA